MDLRLKSLETAKDDATRGKGTPLTEDEEEEEERDLESRKGRSRE